MKHCSTMPKMYIQVTNVYIYIILSTDVKSVDKRNDIKRFQTRLVSKTNESV